MTLVDLAERLGPDGRIRLSWNKKDGWGLILTTASGSNETLVAKTQGSDLERLIEGCVAALKRRDRET